jgi:hypothetical protein
MREFRPPNRPSILRIVLALVVAAITLVPTGFLIRLVAGMSPTSYTIANGRLTVHSGDVTFGDRSVALLDVVEARTVSPRGGRRTNGTGLPGFCVGHFEYADIGAVWQATNCGAPALLVRTRDPKAPALLMTPPDPEVFRAEILSGTDDTITLPPPDKSTIRLVAFVTAPLALVVTGMIAALMFFGPSRMRYRVGDGALEVKTMFGRKRWNVAGARARKYEPTRLWRIAGSAMPGYYTGLFREDGKSTRVYATDVRSMVLLEG